MDVATAARRPDARALRIGVLRPGSWMLCLSGGSQGAFMGLSCS